jgi:hypothetical protein
MLMQILSIPLDPSEFLRLLTNQIQIGLIDWLVRWSSMFALRNTDVYSGGRAPNLKVSSKHFDLCFVLS